jgi:hypothetical protein
MPEHAATDLPGIETIQECDERAEDAWARTVEFQGENLKRAKVGGQGGCCRKKRGPGPNFLVLFVAKTTFPVRCRY